MDLLFASSGIEPELADTAEPLEILPDLVVPVAQVGGLLVLKLLATTPHRPQDEVDLVALLAAADTEQIALARHLAGVVMHRGHHRGRDLPRDLARRLDPSGGGPSGGGAHGGLGKPAG